MRDAAGIVAESRQWGRSLGSQHQVFTNESAKEVWYPQSLGD